MFSSVFVYAACSDCIVKLDMEGNIKQRYDGMDNWTYTVAINNRNEINSSSCWTHKVTVMENSGKKIYSYFHEKLRHPRGLDVNFSGNIFVAGQGSNNIHVLTPGAELLKMFNVASPKCIKFKENSYMCFVGSLLNSTTKVYEFQEDM